MRIYSSAQLCCSLLSQRQSCTIQKQGAEISCVIHFLCCSSLCQRQSPPIPNLGESLPPSPSFARSLDGLRYNSLPGIISGPSSLRRFNVAPGYIYWIPKGYHFVWRPEGGHAVYIYGSLHTEKSQRERDKGAGVTAEPFP